MTTHIVKTMDSHYAAILANQKRFEALPNERDYQKGDTLYIEEVAKNEEGKFAHTGRVLKAVVSHVSSTMQREGVVVVGFIPVPPDESMKKNASVEPSTVPGTAGPTTPAKAVRKIAKDQSSKASDKSRKSANGSSRAKPVPKGSGKDVRGSKKAGVSKSRK